MSSDTYRTLAGRSAAEVKRRSSRFLAEALPAHDEAVAEQEVEKIRRREHKATHHPWAYRLGLGEDRFRYDDDGEPSGTAGAPILRQIDGLGLTNALVVVTRYYGGTKLGTGGLARAYGDAAGEALAAARVEVRTLRTPLCLRFAYDDTAPVRRLIEQFDAEVREERYSAETEWVVGVRRSEAEAFRAAFTNALGGRGFVGKGEGASGGEGDW